MKSVWHIALYMILFLVGHSPKVYGQDGTYSLIVHAPLNINPSFCVPSNRAISLSTNSRHQWLNLPGPSANTAGYQYNQLSFTAPFKSTRNNGYGGALQINQSYAGEGRLRISDANFFLGVRQRLFKQTAVRFALGVGFRQAQVDWTNLVFTSQLDPYLGLINPTSSVNPQNTVTNLAVTPSIGGQIHSHQELRKGMLDIQAGWSIYHWSTPALTFFDQPEPIQPRQVIHGTLKYFPNGRKGLNSVVPTNYFVLSHVFQFQNPHRTNETRLGVNIAKQLTIYQGFRRRHFIEINGNVDAFITSFQLNQPWGMLSIGYDYTISKLDGCTLGTMEFGYTMPLDARFIFNSRYNREPCFVEDLLKASEWKAVEKFSKTATNWGFQYSPVTFIP